MISVLEMCLDVMCPSIALCVGCVLCPGDVMSVLMMCMSRCKSRFCVMIWNCDVQMV